MEGNTSSAIETRSRVQEKQTREKSRDLDRDVHITNDTNIPDGTTNAKSAENIGTVELVRNDKGAPASQANNGQEASDLGFPKAPRTGQAGPEHALTKDVFSLLLERLDVMHKRDKK